ncbi:MAG: prolipoprotein diacylglyceryl transferase [Patescibacteria group bacterium]|nr:prolipoprotein diacylglyceryl transferase [Patescibacteria group bacterium]
MFIHNLNPNLLKIGSVQIRWYGLLFVLGLLFYIFFTRWVFKKANQSVKKLEDLFIYLFFGFLIGARLGHVFFFQWPYYSKNPGDIIKIWQGGLNSHGAMIGLLVAYIIFYFIEKRKNPDFNFYQYSDLLVIGIPIVAMMVRIGNFINAEVLGRLTNSSWGVVYQSLGENIARHPVQIYEAIAALIIFFILLGVFLNKKTKPYFMTFLFLLLYFGSRFILEFFKKYQILEKSGTWTLGLTMGQALSVIPILVTLIYFIYYYPRIKFKE